MVDESSKHRDLEQCGVCGDRGRWFDITLSSSLSGSAVIVSEDFVDTPELITEIHTIYKTFSLPLKDEIGAVAPSTAQRVHITKTSRHSYRWTKSKVLTQNSITHVCAVWLQHTDTNWYTLHRMLQYATASNQALHVPAKYQMYCKHIPIQSINKSIYFPLNFHKYSSNLIVVWWAGQQG